MKPQSHEVVANSEEDQELWPREYNCNVLRVVLTWRLHFWGKRIRDPLGLIRASLVAQMVKNLPAM